MATPPRSLADYFADLRDPRVALKCDHDFLDIILIVVVATIGGADDFVSAGRVRQGQRRTGSASDSVSNSATAFPPTTPSTASSPSSLRPIPERLFGWVESMSDRLKLKQIPIDGKAMRGSKRKTSAGHRTTHIVSAWAAENGVTAGPGADRREIQRNPRRSPNLLALLDVSGAFGEHRRNGAARRKSLNRSSSRRVTTCWR